MATYKKINGFTYTFYAMKGNKRSAIEEADNARKLYEWVHITTHRHCNGYSIYVRNKF